MRGTSWVMGVMVGMAALAPAMRGEAAEHGGQEHAGSATAPATTQPKKEHGGTTQEQGGQAAHAEPSAEQIRQAIRDYVTTTTQTKGAFAIQDAVTGSTRTLTLERVHERVGKTGAFYYSCTDMRDVRSGETLDLDFDVDAKGGQLKVVDVRIHKVNGQPRYTYDSKDHRVPVM